MSRLNKTKPNHALKQTASGKQPQNTDATNQGRDSKGAQGSHSTRHCYNRSPQLKRDGGKKSKIRDDGFRGEHQDREKRVPSAEKEGAAMQGVKDTGHVGMHRRVRHDEKRRDQRYSRL